MELPEVEEMFIFPSCGDETNAIGAAYWVYAQEQIKSGKPVDIEPLGSIYWGGSFGDNEIEDAIKNYSFSCKVSVEFKDDIEKNVAELLAKGDIVARSKGKMEFGARALGNRSILANPSKPKVVKVINEMIKSRDFWMPFAPSVLDSRAQDYLKKPKDIKSPYMTLAFDSKPDRFDKFAAAAHPYDYTLRPQEVSQEFNEDYYKLIKYFEEFTGDGIILNTSFNLHGYPIVYTPEDALQVFDHSGLKYLALGNHLLSKV
jgi:carbamoyltransferase